MSGVNLSNKNASLRRFFSYTNYSTLFVIYGCFLNEMINVYKTPSSVLNDTSVENITFVRSFSIAFGSAIGLYMILFVIRSIDFWRGCRKHRKHYTPKDNSVNIPSCWSDLIIIDYYNEQDMIFFRYSVYFAMLGLNLGILGALIYLVVSKWKVLTTQGRTMYVGFVIGFGIQMILKLIFWLWNPHVSSWSWTSQKASSSGFAEMMPW